MRVDQGMGSDHRSAQASSLRRGVEEHSTPHAAKADADGGGTRRADANVSLCGGLRQPSRPEPALWLIDCVTNAIL